MNKKGEAMENQLPTIKNRKKINLKEFEALAKRVKKYLEDEAAYLEKKKQENGNNKISRILINS